MSFSTLKLYFLFLLSVTFIVSCETGGETIDPKDAPLGTFSLTLVDTTYTIEMAEANFNNSSDISLSLGGGVAIPNLTEGFALEISSTGGVTPALKSYEMIGLETCLNPNDLCAHLTYQKIDLVNPLNNLLQKSLSSSGYLELEILEVDWRRGGMIKGTFAGTLSGNGETPEVKDGVFHLSIEP